MRTRKIKYVQRMREEHSSVNTNTIFFIPKGLKIIQGNKLYKVIFLSKSFTPRVYDKIDMHTVMVRILVCINV